MSKKLPLAREVAAYTDAELDQFLEASRLPNGQRMVVVEDPDNLPESFIQRLRDRAPPPSSKPVDLDEVSARLLQTTRTRSRRRSRSIPSSEASSNDSWNSEEIFRQTLVLERESYDELVKTGGRPFYPVELLPDLSRNPKKYPEILRYWNETLDCPSWSVFENQLWLWKNFLSWQRRQRVVWKDKMAEYNERLRRILPRYSVTAPPFEVQANEALQDKLTQWIEYACYQCRDLQAKRRRLPKEHYEAQRQLLVWTADQIPVIQAEMEHGDVTSLTGVKRSRAEDDGGDDTIEHSPKKQKGVAEHQPADAPPASPPLPEAASASAARERVPDTPDPEAGPRQSPEEKPADAGSSPTAVASGR